MVVLLVFYVDVRNLSSGALKCQSLLIEPAVDRRRVQRALDLQEHFLIRQAPGLHSRGIECRLRTCHQAFKLRQKVLMLPMRSLDALVGREAPSARRSTGFEPFEIRAVVVNIGIPDEVQMESAPQVMSFLLAAVP